MAQKPVSVQALGPNPRANYPKVSCPSSYLCLSSALNLTITLLPSRSPELNPVENIWHYLRQNYLSDRVFETYDDILDTGCDAWNNLFDQPEIITSIGMRKWVHTGQT